MIDSIVKLAIAKEKIKAFDLMQIQWKREIDFTDLAENIDNIMEVSNETIYELLQSCKIVAPKLTHKQRYSRNYNLIISITEDPQLAKRGQTWSDSRLYREFGIDVTNEEVL